MHNRIARLAALLKAMKRWARGIEECAGRLNGGIVYSSCEEAAA